MDETTKALIDHYQKTYELTYSLWQQRNSTFLILIGIVGVATLLTFQGPQAEPLLADAGAKLIHITDPERTAELRSGLPFSLIHATILAAVFYLVVNLSHRAAYVLRNYRYLARLEENIRDRLKLPPGSVAFMRESSFYWAERSPLAGAVKWVYIGMLGFV